MLFSAHSLSDLLYLISHAHFKIVVAAACILYFRKKSLLFFILFDIFFHHISTLLLANHTERLSKFSHSEFSHPSKIKKNILKIKKNSFYPTEFSHPDKNSMIFLIQIVNVIGTLNTANVSMCP